MVGKERKFLIFYMNDRHYAFDLELVAEVMDSAPSWPIPFAPPCYSGSINFHGAIVAVMDLAVFLGFAPSPALEKVVVLDLKVASLAFAVERVTRIVPEKEIEVHKAPALPFASASLRLPEGEALLLDIDAIIREAASTFNI